MATSNTFKFIEIFPTNDDFKDFCLEINILDQLIPEQLTFINFIYNSLLYKFGTVDIAYDTIVEFLMELSLVLSDTFQQYFKQIDLINKVYKFNDDEFSRTSQSIVSHAEQNNTKLDDPSQWLGYVGSQDFNQQSLSKFQGYVQAIRQMPSYDRILFTNKYKYLFSTIIVPNIYFHKGDNHG